MERTPVFSGRSAEEGEEVQEMGVEEDFFVFLMRSQTWTDPSPDMRSSVSRYLINSRQINGVLWGGKCNIKTCFEVFPQL